MKIDDLDSKLHEVFSGKVVRKDLLHRIKKGTNVPTFVLEFLLARYCASDDDAEIQEGLEAVISTLQENYVRADESNAAQSKVATKGKHRFFDKVHVRFVETGKDAKRHWAALENFNSQRIAISDKFYRDNDRILEGGIWAEVTVGYNEIDDDDYAFYIEELKPIQLTKFDFEGYAQGRKAFSRNEWLDVIMRSVGLEGSNLSPRLKLHYILRLAPLVEPNFNFVELGPRGTGKSYFFSEFSPYATLLSGGQATKSTLFYNMMKKRVGLVGFWDTVAFDEVAGIKIKDPDTIQIMKDYLANGRFSRGVEVIADASMAFVGNIDYSIEQVAHSTEHDLFMPLPKEFDLAVMDRFACYLPGWEMPKNSSDYLTGNYGFITDYLAEAFHYQFSHTNRYEEVNKRIKLGKAVEGRDEKSIKKCVCAFLKILHPDDAPSDDEFEEYVAYAVESRRRVKEQMNKRKPDDEFANINLSYIPTDGKEVIVFCPESRGVTATQQPLRHSLGTPLVSESDCSGSAKNQTSAVPVENRHETENIGADQTPPHRHDVTSEPHAPGEHHFTIMYGDTGYSYEAIIGPYINNAREIVIEDPYIRMGYQIQNLVRFCEAVLKLSSIQKIKLITSYDDSTNMAELNERLSELKQSLLEQDVLLDIEINPNLHDREIRVDNGWVIKIGRGLDFYQKPTGWYSIGASDLSLRPCLETKVDIFFGKTK
ncbi:MAG: BREX system Lon protease-like protein [Candidatus Desulfovibrio kirbyi]|uniref:BREX system Lon protease-like protein n=1 Tax=Candidatus Desulfovibrio kirbyi TaxID=2696086 RepID=A0A6L2R5C9_9BACT|nr:MAG: BREX system Lon protease-like protein [Candidatus Desulfovibrio kirbyi]